MPHAQPALRLHQLSTMPPLTVALESREAAPQTGLGPLRAGAWVSRCRRSVLHLVNMPEETSFESP